MAWHGRDKMCVCCVCGWVGGWWWRWVCGWGVGGGVNCVRLVVHHLMARMFLRPFPRISGLKGQTCHHKDASDCKILAGQQFCGATQKLIDAGKLQVGRERG